jgi:CubicO group peptidase (beta-lactamase class C family)
MNRTLACLLISLFLFNFSEAQQKFTEATPESQGFSSEKLQRIDHVMKEYIEQGKMNGTAYLIARNGKIVYYRAVGYDDREANKPLKRDAIFRIASQTKAVTSVAVMMLYEEGKFLLDDPVSKYIHSFKNPRVLDKFNEKDTTYTTIPAKREITIRDLLTHTSGIGYAQIGSKEANAIYAKNNIMAGIGSGRKSLAEDIQLLGSLPLFHNPGEKFTYGLNTDVLGYLIEVVSGITLDEFFRTKIFEPLGMADTYFNIPAEKQDRLVNLYRPDSTGKLAKVVPDLRVNGRMNIDYPKTNNTYFSGGAGLSSTVYDYAVFIQMLLNGGQYNGKRILSRHSVRMMTTNQIGDIPFGNNKFGLGFDIITERGSAKGPAQVGTFSWGGAFATTYWIDPKEKIVAVYYKQLWGDPAGESAEKFRVLLYSAMVD